jgi:hypothetical protein
VVGDRGQREAVFVDDQRVALFQLRQGVREARHILLVQAARGLVE